MATDIGPLDASYLDEKSARDEFSAVASVCGDCRRCTELCGVFPTLFDLLDRSDESDPGRMTPAQQDSVTDECFQCGRCVVGCPNDVDVPRLVLRHAAVRRATGQTPLRSRIGTRLVASRGVLGRAARAAPGSLTRRLIAAVSDLTPDRLIGPTTRTTFSSWFSSRGGATRLSDGESVTVYPTCLVEHEAPRIGRALVEVYEQHGIACADSKAGCCGAPLLHAGDLDGFTAVARRNVARLAAEIGTTGDVVVPQPACLRVLTNDYPDHVSGPDAELVAERCHDATGYLIDAVRSRGVAMNDSRPERGPRRIALHRSDPGGSDTAAALRALTDAEVTVVDRDAGVGAGWGWRRRHVERSLAMARELADELDAVGADVVVGDDHRANTAIRERADALPLHPLEEIARTRGLVADD